VGGAAGEQLEPPRLLEPAERAHQVAAVAIVADVAAVIVADVAATIVVAAAKAAISSKT